MPGSPPSYTDAAGIDTMVALNERCAQLFADRPDVPIHSLALPECEKTLAGHDDQTRRMLDRIRAAGTAEMSGNDLVHPDFTVPNILFDAGKMVTGLVDWNNGVARGDRRFGLVALRYDLVWDSWSADGGQLDVRPGAVERLDEHIAALLQPDLLRRYWAHLTLYKLHFAIVFNHPASIEMQLRLGNSLLTG